MADFMAFRRMLTPFLIQTLFIFVCVVTAAGGLLVVIIGLKHSHARVALEGAGILLLGPLVVRLWAEALIVVFRINESLTDIRALAVWAAERAHIDDSPDVDVLPDLG